MWQTTGLLLSTVHAGDIDRHRQVPGTQQRQRRRSTSLSSKYGQCRVDSRVDETEQTCFCKMST